LGCTSGKANLTSTYGAAASIVIILLWVNYSSWILFVGAEYIYVYVKRRGEENRTVTLRQEDPVRSP
jgi:membrane protein